MIFFIRWMISVVAIQLERSPRQSTDSTNAMLTNFIFIFIYFIFNNNESTFFDCSF